LLLGYLLTGNDWLFETAKSMADFTVRAWKDGHPRDARMDGTLTSVQSRSAYTAKMNLKLYDVTGKKEYLNNAINLAEWAIDCQEPEGWWVMNPDDRIKSRAFRCTPIFTGYIVQGLWPLYWRTGNDKLKSCLLRAADWYMAMQEDAWGFNPGTFPNSYWYGTIGSEDNPVSPVRGNYATTSHAANALLQAYLASDDRKYFYAANAAWVGVLNHQTPKGGIPLENTEESSVWSHVLIESLPHFAAVAEEHGLPLVLSSKTGVPGTSFMGKGATWDGKTFTFELKYRHENPVPLRVFFPGTKPKRLSIDGNEINDLTYNESLHVVSFEMPPSQNFHVCEMRVER
ncbi:MAG: hypothetical protein JXB48_06055, partial [Candidatus Latescibacteria bacterium]|nr:hypothetical protein [Candidatus Latescibacterota bacterium]